MNITEEKEYHSLEHILDGYSKYFLTLDTFLQKIRGIKHLNMVDLL